MKHIATIKMILTLLGASGIIATGAIGFNNREKQLNYAISAVEQINTNIGLLADKVDTVTEMQKDINHDIALIKRNQLNLNSSFVNYIKNDKSLTTDEFYNYIKELPSVRVDSFKIGVRLRNN